VKTIQSAFAKGPCFIAYLTAGDGGMSYTLDAALALVDAGVDILEIGVPFSDPTADGPVIQRAMMRSLQGGTHLAMILELIANIRKRSDVPIILFSYYNPLLAACSSRQFSQQPAVNNFLEQAKLAGVNGLLIVDLPIEEAHDFQCHCDTLQIASIGLLAPTSTQERIKAIADSSQGFLYYVCQRGTTGVRSQLPVEANQSLQEIKRLTSLPVVAGFGIGSREMAASVLQAADGFVVGSALVSAIEKGASPKDLFQLVKNIDPRGQMNGN
jgi:tryptophan synthase alpha chain